jgi:predicted nucleic acid-binding protein
MLMWGQLTGDLELHGKKMSAMDSPISATARHSHFALVTRNVDDFKDAGISIVNPWQ